ncbi:unnamed protein product, partial [Prorocentrum cordatum]
HAPAVNDMNQQWLFMGKNIKPSSNSKIAGRPRAEVANAVRDRAKAVTGCAKFRLLFLGLHGIGKPPAFIVIAMAMGRYTAARSGGDPPPPGRRRSASMGGFKSSQGTASEGALLDDPGMWHLSIDDLKSFFDAAEDTFAKARYNDAEFAKNAARCLAENEFDEKGEPPADNRTSITVAEAEKLSMKPFSGWKQARVLVALKRAIACVSGRRATCARFPSSGPGAAVHRISLDCVEKDWFRDGQFWGAGLVDRAAPARGNKLADAYVAESLQAGDGALALRPRPDEGGSSVFPTGPRAPRTSINHSRCRVDGVGARQARLKGSPPSLVGGQSCDLGGELGAPLVAEGVATQPGAEAGPQASQPKSPSLFPAVG